MSVARHHADWLSLVETTGPFLTMPVLLRVFPHGLEERDSSQAIRLREAYEEWLDRSAQEPAVHRAWIQHVFDDLLEYPPNLLVAGQEIPPGLEAAQPQFGETLRPDWVLKHADTGRPPQLLITLYAPSQKLDGPVAGKVWKATPGTRMMELLHAADIPLGLVTNGEQWMLVYAPRGESTGFASWYADLWMQEPITLRAFHALLHVRRFLGVAEEETLSALYAASSKDQQEVTDQLGYQVRQAVEMLVQAFDGIDAESGRQLLVGTSEKELYNGALTVMMRLVFLFSAEERGLLLLGDALYDQHYAVSTLRALLRERADHYGEEILERRRDAWVRLLATFRAVFGGVQHEAMRLPAYGGTLFDPDRYPFLEGRPKETSWTSIPAKPLPINNRIVLHLLEALQMLQVKVPGGGPAEARRLSFVALDIEQIGHVYEGLLDHTAKRASEPILGLAGSKDKEPEISLSELERVSQQGIEKVLEFLHEETGRTEKSLARLLKDPSEVDAHALLLACGQDVALLKRVQSFASLLRTDSFGNLVVIPQGSVYVTSGSDRRSTGTHYTPRSLTEPIVQYTLEPLVYVGPAEGKPKEEWQLKSPKEILALKVCDMAMGSGAFLVQACRYLSERLGEAWEQTEMAHPGKVVITPDGELSIGSPSERLIPADPAERMAIARRTIADRCLYGVDINPMAVEMAKLSLWLVTLQRDRPFTFLDHAFKCGDSLLGVSSLQQIEDFSLRPGPVQTTISTVNLFRFIEEAAAKRKALEGLPSYDYGQIETKIRLHNEAEAATTNVKALADCLIALELRGLTGEGYTTQRAVATDQVEREMAKPLSDFEKYAKEQLNDRCIFHWPAEYPEVFASGGFHAFLGNPPFVGGRRMRQSVGDEATEILRLIWPHASLNADLCVFFYLRAADFLCPGGSLGFLGTKTIGQGDTARTGLVYLLDNQGFEIVAARSSFKWPGTAAVIAALFVAFRGLWKGVRILNDRVVASISAVLDDQGKWGNAKILSNNMERSFQGSVLVGLGFVLEPDEALAFLSQRVENAEVVHPYLGGEDLNTHPEQQASRWAIDFRDYDLSKCEKRWPELLDRIRSLVKPQRDSVRRAAHRKYWWHHGDKRPELYSRICGCDGVFVIARVTKYVTLVRVRADQVFHDKVYVFDLRGWGDFAILQSTFHDTWVRRGSSTVGETLNYTPSDYFDTFPFLHLLQETLRPLGSAYHDFRRGIMLGRQEGLTKTYNRFHDPGEQSEDITQLRALHVQMDQAVAIAYGWGDLDLGHCFNQTKQGIRYTLSESARQTILDRLLILNHKCYEEEVRVGLHKKKKVKGRKAKTGEIGVVAESPAAYGSDPQRNLFE